MATKVKAKGRELTVERKQQDDGMETVVEIVDAGGEVAEVHRLAGGKDITFVFMPSHSVRISERELD